MSNVLKKITKKYKWLRFLNRKVTKLSVLGASLVGLCVSSGASFAKYRDENYGNDNAVIAKLGIATMYDKSIKIAEAQVNHEGIYALVADFKIVISESEVSRTFTLDLRMTNSETTNFTASTDYDTKLNHFRILGTSGNVFSDKLYTISSTTNTSEETNLKTLTGDNSSKLDNVYYNNVYYALSEDGTTFNWDRKEITKDTFTMINSMDINKVETSLYFKIVYFIELYKQDGDFIKEDAHILYNFSLSQKGGNNNV